MITEDIKKLLEGSEPYIDRALKAARKIGDSKAIRWYESEKKMVAGIESIDLRGLTTDNSRSPYAHRLKTNAEIEKEIRENIRRDAYN